MKPRHVHRIDRERCKGCGLCVASCPKNVLEIHTELNRKGYFPAFQACPGDCVFCAICCTVCPDVAIEIEEQDAPDTAGKGTR